MNEGKIRVLHVIRHMNTGGAETLIMNLYRNVEKLNIFKSIYCFINYAINAVLRRI